MNRRSFLSTLVGGVAVAAAQRAWPFRVYSFGSEVKPPLALELENVREQIPLIWPLYMRTKRGGVVPVNSVEEMKIWKTRGFEPESAEAQAFRRRLPGGFNTSLTSNRVVTKIDQERKEIVIASMPKVEEIQVVGEPLVGHRNFKGDWR